MQFGNPVKRIPDGEANGASEDRHKLTFYDAYASERFPNRSRQHNEGARLWFWRVVSMLPFDLDRVRKNVEEATTIDLLERATVFREGMELEALELIETELRRRGISFKEQAEFCACPGE